MTATRSLAPAQNWVSLTLRKRSGLLLSHCDSRKNVKGVMQCVESHVVSAVERSPAIVRSRRPLLVPDSTIHVMRRTAWEPTDLEVRGAVENSAGMPDATNGGIIDLNV